jgi:hypothetical protein
VPRMMNGDERLGAQAELLVDRRTLPPSAALAPCDLTGLGSAPWEIPKEQEPARTQRWTGMETLPLSSDSSAAGFCVGLTRLLAASSWQLTVVIGIDRSLCSMYSTGFG